jgi:hypothetical protein
MAISSAGQARLPSQATICDDGRKPQTHHQRAWPNRHRPTARVPPCTTCHPCGPASSTILPPACYRCASMHHRPSTWACTFRNPVTIESDLLGPHRYLPAGHSLDLATRTEQVDEPYRI